MTSHARNNTNGCKETSITDNPSTNFNLFQPSNNDYSISKVIWRKHLQMKLSFFKIHYQFDKLTNYNVRKNIRSAKIKGIKVFDLRS